MPKHSEELGLFIILEPSDISAVTVNAGVQFKAVLSVNIDVELKHVIAHYVNHYRHYKSRPHMAITMLNLD